MDQDDLADVVAADELLVRAADLRQRDAGLGGQADAAVGEHRPDLVLDGGADRGLLGVGAVAQRRRGHGPLLGEQLAGYEAAELLAHGTVVNGVTLVTWLSTQHSPDALKAVAARLSAHPATIGLLAGTAGDKVTVIFCRSADLDLHMGTLLRDTLRAFGGGGGGRPEHAQGGGIAPELAQAALDHASGLVLEQKKD